ncbi:HAMP domain-containing protein [Mucilaginibacter sp.]
MACAGCNFNRNDEFGELAITFNSMFIRLHR